MKGRTEETGPNMGVRNLFPLYFKIGQQSEAKHK